MVKIQAGVQQYLYRECADVQAGFREARGTRDQIANIYLIIKKSKRIPEKISTSVSMTMLKPLTLWITTNCGKFFKRWEYHLPPEKSLCRS